MSEGEKGFLARWSQRKLDVSKAEAKPAAQAEPASPADAAASETEPPFDLESLPKLEDLTADTDMTVFFRKGVPESIRNAALRKSWALDPAIRNYVNPALDYAYDWNTPGGVPGSGELAPGTDIARMVSQIMGSVGPSPEAVEKAKDTEADRRDVLDGDAAEHQDEPTLPVSPVRLSELSTPSEKQAVAESPETSAPDASGESSEQQTQPSASQQTSRRHGSARPK